METTPHAPTLIEVVTVQRTVDACHVVDVYQRQTSNGEPGIELDISGGSLTGHRFYMDIPTALEIARKLIGVASGDEDVIAEALPF